MQNENDVNPADAELEAALHRLKPSSTTIDPIRIAFDAGARSRRSQLRGWRAATGMVACLAISAVMGSRSNNREASGDFGAFAIAQPVSEPAYLNMRNLVLRDGEAALVAPRGATPRDIPTVRDMLDDLR